MMSLCEEWACPPWRSMEGPGTSILAELGGPGEQGSQKRAGR